MYVTKRPWDLPAWSTGRLYCSKHMDLLMLQGQKPSTEKEISRSRDLTSNCFWNHISLQERSHFCHVPGKKPAPP